MLRFQTDEERAGARAAAVSSIDEGRYSDDIDLLYRADKLSPSAGSEAEACAREAARRSLSLLRALLARD